MGRVVLEKTLIRLLMTLEEPTFGIIEVGGDPLWHMEVNGKLVNANEKYLHKVREKIGMVFQQFNLIPHMSVLHNFIESARQVIVFSEKESIVRAKKCSEKLGRIK